MIYDFLILLFIKKKEEILFWSHIHTLQWTVFSAFCGAVGSCCAAPWDQIQIVISACSRALIRINRRYRSFSVPRWGDFHQLPHHSSSCSLFLNFISKVSSNWNQHPGQVPGDGTPHMQRNEQRTHTHTHTLISQLHALFSVFWPISAHCLETRV